MAGFIPELDGISYDEDGTYAITREKGTESSVLGFSDGTLVFYPDSGESYMFNRNFSLQHAFLMNIIIRLSIINEKSKRN